MRAIRFPARSRDATQVAFIESQGLGGDDYALSLVITDPALNPQRRFPLIRSAFADESRTGAEARAVYRARRQRGIEANRYLVEHRFVSLIRFISLVTDLEVYRPGPAPPLRRGVNRCGR